MSTLLLWSFLIPLPTLILSALGIPKKAGVISFLSPMIIGLLAILHLVSGASPLSFVHEQWLPFLPDARFSLYVDNLAAVLLAVVGLVGACVYGFSIEYMHHDARRWRFFAFLDFFIIAMSLLVLAGNLTVLLVGWTLVGIASFLLISFWWEKGYPLKAGFLALGVNAIGDGALLLAVVMLPTAAADLHSMHTLLADKPTTATAIAWMLVVAACAKSAQGPLWFWLPSAMAGPTPVSALIHAATMVAAGVYLLVRTFDVLALSPEVLSAVATVGMMTALCGGLASLWQSNFKKGLAYSTASQLGMMFVAIGVSAPFAAYFHLVTHAGFKALLFLTAGFVIHCTHHEEDLHKLGGLRTKLPLAHAFFLIGSLAMIGTPFLSGAFSKDSIIEAALHSSSPVMGYLLMVVSFFTGLYSGRLFFRVFYGPEGESSLSCFSFTIHVHIYTSSFGVRRRGGRLS